MRTATASTISVVAAGLFAALGLGFNSFDLLFTSAITGGAGLVLRLAPLKAGWWRTAIAHGEGRIDQLEKHLRATEDELDSVTRELTILKEQHDFDLQLLTSHSTSTGRRAPE